jgi:hypothetical protein
MPIVAKLDELGRGAWIALMVLGFVFWWPVGLAILAFSLWSGRMGCWNHHGMTRWQGQMGRGRDWWGPQRSSGCAWPRTRLNSTSSWPIAGTDPRHRNRKPDESSSGVFDRAAQLRPGMFLALAIIALRICIPLVTQC